MSETKFEKAVSIIQNLPKEGSIQPTQDDQLFFYKYYKQAKEGNNTKPRPGFMDFTGKAKWDAWTSVKDTSKEESYKQYVDKLLEILNKIGDDESKKYIEEIENA